MATPTTPRNVTLEAGQFSSTHDRKTICKLCPCGKVSAPGAAECGQECGNGFYVEGDAASQECRACPPRHFCVNMRKEPLSQARNCTPGRFVRSNATRYADRQCGDVVEHWVWFWDPFCSKSGFPIRRSFLSIKRTGK